MSSIKNVAVAGATGSLGSVLVKQLVQDGFSVTALTRGGSDALPAEVKARQVDYNDPTSLKNALAGQDAVVSTITTMGIDSQRNLIEAAVASKIQRFIPSEFGCDLSNAKARQLPVYGSKVQIQEALEAKTKGTETSYTYVYNNAFLDWGIDKGFLIDIKNKKLEVYNDGDANVTFTPLPIVAKAVSAVLQHPEDTKNTHVKVHGAKLTQNKFLELAQKVVGENGWEITKISTEEVQRKSYEELKSGQGNIMGAMIGFLKVAIYGDGYGGDFSSNNDNKLLGLKELSESEVEEVIRDRAKAV